ncbi:sterol desaturase family protein [Mucilaginibacter agri]|uniref:Sterol desaturase family protein n=1 Tax=Mucilaginibacter agri TaxID=2695265 RepID=A0A965ZIT3_9SPHI|nr:sterol desaturase family protein [Mucilaginibacter agri]NCD70857.1 sterol desaturase family protein [Mucilaginibacter agri]
MNSILQTILNEIIGFLSLGGIIEMFKTGDFSRLSTLSGLLGTLYTLIPALLVFEIVSALIMRRFSRSHYQIPFLVYVLNRFISVFVSFGMVGFCIGLFEKHAIFKSSVTWYWFIYGYIVWEFGHFIYHYLGHKVRLFWCLHSTHHTPQEMNLFVNHAHFFLEAPYADVIRTTVCILLGVSPTMLFLIMAIDGLWGSFIHIGDNIAKNARLGFLNKIILTPSHHRVHHAKNPLYMDTNFCNLLNIWDRVFKTYQDEMYDVKIEYGITREMKPNSLWDSYFGEFVCLFKDMAAAPGIKNKLLYVVMPPGWSHKGDHKTAKVTKEAYLQESRSHIAEGVGS